MREFRRLVEHVGALHLGAGNKEELFVSVFGEIAKALVEEERTHHIPPRLMLRPVQFFTNERWRAQSQTNRIATFVGIPKVPVMKIIIMLILLACLAVPGIIYYILVVSKLRGMQNMAGLFAARGKTLSTRHCENSSHVLRGVWHPPIPTGKLPGGVGNAKNIWPC